MNGPAPSPPASAGLQASGSPADSGRLQRTVAGSLLILGSFLFLGGGRAHPSIGAVAGASPTEFFHAFAEEVHQTGGWHSIHLLILLGPLLWAVAAPALMDGLAPRAASTTSTARSLLLLAGALWAVAFVLDGFGAPVYARVLAETGPADVQPWALASFEALALMMSRLGLVSWVACGLGIAVLGGVLLTKPVRTSWRMAVGVSGIALGLWPLIAALEGEYAGGPFTSGYWMLNALAVGLWFMALASCGIFGRPNPRVAL